MLALDSKSSILNTMAEANMPHFSEEGVGALAQLIYYFDGVEPVVRGLLAEQNALGPGHPHFWDILSGRMVGLGIAFTQLASLQGEKLSPEKLHDCMVREWLHDIGHEPSAIFTFH